MPGQAAYLSLKVQPAQSTVIALVGRCRGLRRPGPHGHRFGRPLSRPPKASVWGHVQDQPRSTCLVKMIWVKDQHAQHWPWTLMRRMQGGGRPAWAGRPLSRPPKARSAPRSSLWSAAVAASEGQCLGSCPRSAKISMSSQDDLGQGPACSALAMDPKQMEVRGLRPLASNG